MSVFMRVVIDTSTLVSAAQRVGSVPHRALVHALSACELCACEFTRAELDDVLMRPRFDRYHSADLRRAFASFLRRQFSMFVVTAADIAKVQPPCRNPKDNQFLALGKACNADALISIDADLLVLHPWQGLPILTPAAYLERVGAEAWGRPGRASDVQRGRKLFHTRFGSLPR